MRNEGKTITRELLKAAAASAALAPLRQEGPHVWLDMDQKELDDAYNQTVYAANLPADRTALRDQQRGRTGTPGRTRATGLRH